MHNIICGHKGAPFTLVTTDAATEGVTWFFPFFLVPYHLEADTLEQR